MNALIKYVAFVIRLQGNTEIFDGILMYYRLRAIFKLSMILITIFFIFIYFYIFDLIAS